jgi:hypothetical protein
MPYTAKQNLGILGEILVVKTCICPKCKRNRTLKRLPPNFKCADIICDFCGYLGQVKAATVKNVNKVPDVVLGAAWKPQNERMDAGIYFSLFLVLVSGTKRAIYYIPSDFQDRKLFKPRQPLSQTARRAGWQGFIYDLKAIKQLIVRLR